MLLKRKTSAETLKLQEKYGVPYLVFPSLENTGLVRHAFSTRLGGCSTGDLATMNLSSTRGDDPENVKENFQRFGAAVGFDPKDLVLSLQTHTTNVRLVTEEDRGKGFTRPRDYKDVDGLITNVPGLVLATFYADCVPLFCGSGASCHRIVSFRLERNGEPHGRSDSAADERSVWHKAF